MICLQMTPFLFASVIGGGRRFNWNCVETLEMTCMNASNLHRMTKEWNLCTESRPYPSEGISGSCHTLIRVNTV